MGVSDCVYRGSNGHRNTQSPQPSRSIQNKPVVASHSAIHATGLFDRRNLRPRLPVDSISIGGVPNHSSTNTGD